MLGAPGVGKSGEIKEPAKTKLYACTVALVVRLLTKRYIGEYDHQADTRYKNEILVDGDPVIFEICDTCPKVGILNSFALFTDQLRAWMTCRAARR